MTEPRDTIEIGTGYPFGQLLRALADSGPNGAARVARWESVIRGMTDGQITVGSRTPVADTPAWVTLEVAHGGFATGHLVAGGALTASEREMRASIGRAGPSEGRTDLNVHFLCDAGRAALSRMLADGCFRIQTPEESALLVVTWLLQHGESDRAATLVETIAPFFDRLRFYPTPHATPMREGTGVSVMTAGSVVERLRTARARPAIERMNETLLLWTPLYDRAVALFLETVDGDTPTFARYATGALERDTKGQPVVTGGYPCRRFADDWRPRARNLLAAYRDARSRHTLSGKPDDPKENFARLRVYLERCVDDSAPLKPREVAMVRKIIASFVARHGAPESALRRRTRASQMRVGALPVHRDVALILAERLARLPPDEGVPDLAPLLAALDTREAARLDAAPGLEIPRRLAAKTSFCLEAPIEVLVERGLVASSESLARLLPSLTAHARTADIADEGLRRVYEATYVAFRSRRSLLLVNLESQIRFEELPWVAAIAPWVRSSDTPEHASRALLARTVTLALTGFPQTVLPNPLMKEIRTLAKGAGLSLPLTDELAADIFMGTFTAPFLLASKVAARLLSDSLYARYYGIPFDLVLELDDLAASAHGPPTSKGFDALAEMLADVAKVPGSVTRNAMIIEQAQILTTHNLAVLFDAFDLARTLPLGELAQKTFRWICHTQRMTTTNRNALRARAKSAALAFRQMVFYLSFVDARAVAEFLEFAEAHLEGLPSTLAKRLGPALVGLRTAAAGGRVTSIRDDDAVNGMRLLGVMHGTHVLVGAPETSAR